jgi:hypothetical protein
LIAGGAGLAALAVATGFGIDALKANSAISAACGADGIHNAANCPTKLDATTLPLADRRTRGRNVFLGLGVVGLGGIISGIVGLARGPRGASVAVFVSPSGALFTVRTSF